MPSLQFETRSTYSSRQPGLALSAHTDLLVDLKTCCAPRELQDVR